MKRVGLPFLFLGLMVMGSMPLMAQRNPRGTAKLMIQGKEVTVEYGRPSLKGRQVEQLLKQVPEGGVWRLGADQSTTFSTETDLVFGSTTIPSGKYSLWARKGAGGGWSLVFNKQTGQWGTQHDTAQDMAAVPLTESKAAKSVEMVTVRLDGKKQVNGGTITIEWGDLALSAKFKAK